MKLKEQAGRSVTLLEQVYTFAGGEDLRGCIQCGTCAGSCPNANKMDYTPRQMVALLREESKESDEKVLRSNSMWFCTSCYLCKVRCPRGINITDIMYDLKRLSVRHSLTRRRGRTSTLTRTFVENVNNYGRIHEMDFMVRYHMRLNPLELVGMIPLGWRMLRRGRMPLKGHRIKALVQLRAIMAKAEQLEAAV